ncbi:MAG: uncharacterized protein A8A55_3121 [Amphiamblys sp. WSBS2006]|nr:MAG: uncharacterized protein A8A55_3121 [Amphiamblys sp. WSBS2006]
MDEYRKAVGGSGGCRFLLSALVAQLQAPASFSLTCDLPNEAVLLTEKTTVTLKNIAISVRLFLVLLEKTRVTVGESFSITKYARNEDCIREHGMAGNGLFYLGGFGAVPRLALENIERMLPNSIGCVLREVYLFDTGLINILPKLGISEDSVIEEFKLVASEEEHVAGILKQKNPFCVGRVKKMWLLGYAVGVITKMSLKDCEFEYLELSATRREHVAEVLKQERPFCLGRVKTMWLEGYAVGVITKMSLKDCEIESLILYATRKEYINEILKQENPFCVGRVKNMYLWVYAASVITKMTIHGDNTMENFVLVGNEDQLSKIIGEGDNSIDLGRIRTDGLRVPERIKRKLRYTLVDGEGKEVLEEEITTSDGEGKEVLEEERWTSIYALVDGEGEEVLEEESDEEVLEERDKSKWWRRMWCGCDEEERF